MGMMAIPLSDVIDRMTIFKLKVERLPEDNCVSELLGLYQAEFEQRLHDKSKEFIEEIKKLAVQLYYTNKSIWNLEYSIRIGVLTEERNLEEIGKRAVGIRENNKKRIQIKNKIAEIACEKHGLDKKIDHGSA